MDGGPAISAPRSLPRARTVLLAAVVGQAAVSAIYQGLPSLGPALQTTFGVDAAGVGLLFGGIGLGTAAAVIAWGRLLDRVGDRIVGITGLVGSAVLVGAAAVGASQRQYAATLVALIAVGVFAASPTIAITKGMARAFAGTRRFGLAFGIRQAAVPLGGVTASLVLPLIAVRVSLAFALTLLSVALALCAVIVGRVLGRDASASRTAIRPPAPWRRIWRLLAAAGTYTFTQLGLVSLLTLFLFNEHGWTPVASAMGYAGMMAAVVVVRVVVGHLGDRFSPARVPMVRAVGVTVAVLLLASAATVQLPVSVPLILLTTVAAMTWNPLLFALTVEFVPPERVGATQGVLNAVIFLAGGLSPITTAAIVSAFDWNWAWLLLATCSLAGAVLMLRVRLSPDSEPRSAPR